MADYLRTKGGLSGFDYRLFTNYEAQVGALVEGHIDVAWNGPVAHVLTEDLTQEYRPQAQLVSLGQRDVDRDFPTVCLVRKDAVDTDKPKPSHLEELSLATGSSDSPQGHIVPVDWLTHTMDVKPSAIHAYEADLGKHGDTALGEVLALQALVDGKAHAALLSDMMYQRGLQGLLDGVDADSLRQYTTLMDASPPPFDHCIFDAVFTDDQQDKKFQVLSKALLAMDIEDPAATEAMRLEGIKKCWMPPRVDPTGIVRDALHRKGLAQRSFQQSHGVHQSTHRAYCTTSICPQQKVGVIGAGVAGLQTIKALQAKGMDVKAFEAADGVGGLWRENYLSYGVQVPKQLYEFPDFPFDEVPEGKYPTGKQTCDYIKRFAEQHGLLNSIQFQTTVISAVPDEKGHWKVTTVDRTSSIPVSHEFDKLVVATGLYSTANKFVPKAEGINSFLGEVMHSSDFRSANQAKAKKVVVVGGGNLPLMWLWQRRPRVRLR
jgi:ABC-type phosphate/phosphonate transport system substrate-binding protein